MIQIKKNNVIIPLKVWNELRESNYFRELIEVLEDSKELEKAKRKQPILMTLRNMTEREEQI